MNTATTLTHGSIELFQSSMREKGRATNTIRAYGSDLRVLLLWKGDCVSHQSLASMTASWLNETRESAAPKTTERRLISSRAYAKWAGLENFLSDYSAPKPGRGIPHPIPEGIAGVVRMCEDANNQSEQALFAFQGLLGMRVSEARAIFTRHIDVNEMTVTVRGKGDVTRVVPIGDKAWKFIEPSYTRAMIDGCPLVVLSDRGARYAVTASGKRLDFQRAISSHDLRATCATAMYDKTKDLRATQEMLGHASSTTTEIYTFVGMTAMREGMSF